MDEIGIGFSFLRMHLTLFCFLRNFCDLLVAHMVTDSFELHAEKDSSGSHFWTIRNKWLKKKVYDAISCVTHNEQLHINRYIINGF